MAAEEELKQLIQSLHDQENLDEKFGEMMKELKTPQNPHFAVETFNKFKNDVGTLIENLGNNLLRNAEDTLIHRLKSKFDYSSVTKVALELRETCSRHGCCRMALACGDLGDASGAEDFEGCIMVFQKVRSEYMVLEENLNRIAELDRRIYDKEIARNHFTIHL